MKIANTGPVSNASARRSQKTGGGSGFAGQVNGSSPARGAAPPAGVSSVMALLTVQEVGDSLEEKKRAIQRGDDLLDQLGDLRDGLLTGRFSSAGLDRILSMVQERGRRVNDPVLREILQEIEVRAAVELAKLGQIT